MDVGTNNVIDNIDVFRDTFVDLNDQGNVLLALGDDALAGFLASEATCPAVSTVNYESYITYYDAAVNGFIAVVEPLPAEMDDLTHKARLYGIHYNALAIWLIYTITIALVVLYIAAYCLRWRSIIVFAATVNLAVLVLMLLACIVEMILVVLRDQFL
jgi:hypothetical protein